MGGGNGDHIALLQTGDPVIVGAGALADIQAVCIGNGDADRIAGGLFRNDFIGSPGLAELDPALCGLAPFDAVGVHAISGNGQLRTGRVLLHNLLHTPGIHVHIAGGNALIVRSNALAVALALLPVGIEQLAAVVAIQNGNPFAAVLLGVPAQEPVSCLGGFRLGSSGAQGIVTLNPGGITRIHHIVIEIHKIVPGRHSILIHALIVDIAFNQTAVDQRLQNLLVAAGTCGAPHGKDVQEIVSGDAIQHSLPQHGIVIQPAGTHIVCKGQQSIKLILGKFQLIALAEIIQAGLKSCQLFPHQRIRFFLGNSVGIVSRIAGSTVADGIVTVVAHREGRKPLESLDQCNDLLTALHIVGCGDGGHGKRNCAEQKNRRKKQRNQTSSHTLYSFSF